MAEDNDDINPCSKLLDHYERMRYEDDLREGVEALAWFILIFCVLICALLSVALEVTEAIMALPTLTVIAYHKRHKFKALKDKITEGRHAHLDR